MKTVLVTASYVDGFDGLGNSRLNRHLRYLRYYMPLRDQLNFQDIMFLDNCSPHLSLLKCKAEEPNLKVRRFEEHLTGGAFAQDYLYCWRALYELPRLLNTYDRILAIDSDFFVLSQRMAEWIRSLDTGWNTVWCPRWQFPEAAMQVICKDAYDSLYNFCLAPMKMRNGSLMERQLPFTNINKELNCDRFGEVDAPQTKGMDGYGQARLTQPLTFGAFE